MSKTTFTPGPWKVYGGIKGDRLFVTAYAKDPDDPSRNLIVDRMDETHPEMPIVNLAPVLGFHYLRPISEEKLREVMGEVWSAAYNKTLEDSICQERGLVPDDFPDRETSITNAINKLKDEK